MLCTQPRRISAVGVAQRVASERCEAIGRTVGYRIRLESRCGPETRLEFVTTGILLRRLQSDPKLAGISHVVVDEVHERSAQADFLLVILRDLLAANPDLRVILMSATLDGSDFQAYFSDFAVGAVSIPGFTHPVELRYLEDAVLATGYFPQGRFRSAQPRRRADAKPAGPARVAEALRWMQEDVIDFDLIEALLLHTVQQDGDGEAGAILVFLPGLGEIRKLEKRVRESGALACMWPVSLHSSLPPNSQKQVFRAAPPGKRKLVLSTNIAETSITIADVVTVIDCGRVKEMRFDAARNLGILEEVWISRASAAQRSGRAGRVRPGQAWRLYPRQLHDHRMAAAAVPELCRAPLSDVILQIELLELGDPAAFLSKALTPPKRKAVADALASLVELGALEATGGLTPLGFHLARLPVDPRLGKILVFGAMFRALDPVLTIAAILSHRSPFLMSPGGDESRRQFAGTSMSDHIAALRAYEGWAAATGGTTPAKRPVCHQWKAGACSRGDSCRFAHNDEGLVMGGGGDDGWAYCRSKSLAFQVLGQVRALREQLRGHLVDAGFACGDDQRDNEVGRLLCAPPEARRC